MKTIKQWLQTLPLPYREQSLKNLNKKEGSKKVKSLGSALLWAFDWEMSEQGLSYWIEAEHKANCGEFNKKTYW